MHYNVNFFRFSQILLNLACTSAAHHETNGTFVPAPLIAYLITLGLEKEFIVLEKVFDFGSKNLYEPKYLNSKELR